MNSWEIIYEYCEHPACNASRSVTGRPNCTDVTHQKTVIIHGVVGIPSINLFLGKSLVKDRKHGSVRIFGARQATLFKSLLRSISCLPAIATLMRWRAGVTMLKNAHPPRFFTRPTEIFAHRAILKNTLPTARTHKHTVKRTVPNFLTADYAIAPARLIGFMLLAIGIGGIVGPFVPQIRMESGYAMERLETSYKRLATNQPPLPKSVPVIVEPLLDANGAMITPVNENFAIVIPKIGVNAPVIANVDPTKPAIYDSALLQGVAHASTSFTPDGNGTVYLFSHSTSYDWFVRDLNAVFYLVKNLDKGDTIVLIYNRKRYTYKITDKKVVASKNTSYLYPAAGKRSLILQTCWPPGSTAERLLIFADLIEGGKTI